MRIINKLGLLLPVLSLVLFTACDKKDRAFPEGLLVQGDPIHPVCMRKLDQGDSSRFDPKPVLCKVSVGDQNHLKIDDEHKSVTFYQTYKNGEEVFSSYRYFGSYEGKHVLVFSHHSNQGSGNFISLILVERQGKYIVNKGELAGGDRAFGGIIENIALSGSQLTYEQNFSPKEFVKERVADFPKDIYGSPQDYGYGDRLVYHVDLSQPQEKNGRPTYPPKKVQLKFSGQETEQGNASSSPFDRCYLEKRQAYLEKGHVLLSEDEAKVFANAVVACLKGEK